MTLNRRVWLGAAAAAAAGLARPLRAASAPLRLAYAQEWSSSRLTTEIAATLIRRELHVEVSLTPAAGGPMWAALAAGRIDAMLMAWLPATHATYWARYRRQLVDLGPITRGTWLGLAVPDYVPIDSLTQLGAAHAKFGHRIVGIEAGAGLMINTQRAISVYRMHGMQLMSSSTTAMQAQLARAIARRRWIVVTAWKPLGIWSRFALKPLADPRQVYDVDGHIDAIIHPALAQRQPRIVAFLRRFRLPLDELQSMMVRLDRGEPLSRLTEGWIGEHADAIARWTRG